jgi:hypothetical protein
MRSGRPRAARPYKTPKRRERLSLHHFPSQRVWGVQHPQRSWRERREDVGKAEPFENPRQQKAGGQSVGFRSRARALRAEDSPTAIDKTSESREAVTSAGPAPPLSPPQPKRGVRRRQETVDRSEESEFRSQELASILFT